VNSMVGKGLQIGDFLKMVEVAPRELKGKVEGGRSLKKEAYSSIRRRW